MHSHHVQWLFNCFFKRFFLGAGSKSSGEQLIIYINLEFTQHGISKYLKIQS